MNCVFERGQMMRLAGLSRSCLALIAWMGVSAAVCEAAFVVTPTNYKDGVDPAENWIWNTNAWKGSYNDPEHQLPTALQGLGLERLYKFTPTNTEEFSFAANYSTTVPAPSLAKASGLIKYDGGAFINNAAKYLLLKDGNLDDYVFDISGWDGKEDLIFHSFWGGNQGKLSHFTILGGDIQNGPTPVPEPASLAMWVIAGTIGVRMARRRRSATSI